MLNIGIIEDNTELRESYKAFFSDSTKINCILTTDSTASFLNWHRNYMDIQIILLANSIPGFSEYEDISLLKNKVSNIDIVILSEQDDKENIIRALRAGANGYLLKNIPLPKLEEHLLELKKGGSPLSPLIARQILEYFNPPKTTASSRKKNGLTAREKLVIKMIIEGMTFKKISEQLGISYNGVNYYVKNIYKKLKVHSKSEMTKKYIDGMIEF